MTYYPPLRKWAIFTEQLKLSHSNVVCIKELSRNLVVCWSVLVLFHFNARFCFCKKSERRKLLLKFWYWKSGSFHKYWTLISTIWSVELMSQWVREIVALRYYRSMKKKKCAKNLFSSSSSSDLFFLFFFRPTFTSNSLPSSI